MERAISVFPDGLSSSSRPFHTLLTLRQQLASTLFTSHVYYQLVELLFFATIIYLAFTRAYRPWTRNSEPALSLEEQARILRSWKPVPLTAAPLNSAFGDEGVLAESCTTARAPRDKEQPSAPLDIEITANGAGPQLTVSNSLRLKTNIASANYLGLLKHPVVENATIDTLNSYGVGSCGPRGFYGTTDVHLKCEDTIAKFCNTSSAILYSFGSVTGNSTIPAFMKRGDVVVIDDALSYSLRLGVRISRANVLTYKHNDMTSLRLALLKAVENDVKTPSLRMTQRRLIIVEGISDVMGDVCPLDEVIKLKEEFKFRVLLDESHSLGVLGRTGRGALEEFNIPRSKIEISTADLGNAIASIGGFCVGSDDDLVNHQRLSGAGYCFSASQPPFLAKAATVALEIVKEEGHSLVSILRKRIETFVECVSIERVREAGWTVSYDLRSPLVFFRRAVASEENYSLCMKVARLCYERDVVIATPKRLFDRDEDGVSSFARAPSLRATLSAALSTEETRLAAFTIRDVICG